MASVKTGFGPLTFFSQVMYTYTVFLQKLENRKVITNLKLKFVPAKKSIRIVQIHDKILSSKRANILGISHPDLASHYCT
jgi:hypothetical protein